MGEYTPTESDVREEWAYGAQDLDMDGNVVVSFDEAHAQFDRFIARVKAEAVAGAMRELRHDLTVARKELVDLRDENDRLERILQAPLSLKDLEVAWEAAGQAEECRAGDVLIIQDDEDNYVVRRMDDGSYLDSTARILSRSPREPWADLADVLVAESVVFDSEDASIAARALHSAGVRVMGGDDDE